MRPPRMPPQQVAVRALSAALPGLRVSTKLPEPRPPEHVVVSRVGSAPPPFGANVPRFLIECYAPDDLAAEELGERVHSVWRRLRSHGINWADTDDNLAPFDAPDPKYSRFQFTGSLQILL